MSKKECDPSVTVDSFFARPFSMRPHAEQLGIVRNGRPMPALSTLLSTHQEQYRNIYKPANRERTKEYVLQFQAAHYDRVPWLAGSEALNKLYCWPCLLFSVEKTMWNNEGFDHLKGLINAVQKHDRSQNHVASVVAYKTFDRVASDKPDKLAEDEYKRVDQHNAKVRKNQEILHRLIDVICFVSRLEYPSGGRVDSRCSPKSILMATLQLISPHIPLLKGYLESCADTPETITRVEEELIAALVHVITRSDVNVARYVSVILNETTDREGRSQLVTALRYVTPIGETCERVVQFDDVTGKTATEAFDHVYKTICELKLKDKLIAHGCASSTGDAECLSTKVTASFPKAPLVHCHRHTVNVMLEQAMYHMKKCRRFFQTVNALASFFNDSPRRVDRLDAFMRRRFDTRMRPGVWRVTSRVVNTAHQYRYELVEFFKELLDDKRDRDVVDSVVVLARGFLVAFTSFDFRFLLIVLSTLFDLTDALCVVLRTKSYDVECCVAKVNATVAAIKADMVRYDTVWSQVLRDTLEVEPPRGKTQRNNQHHLKESYRCFYRDIVNTITKQIVQRFKSLESHVFVGLVNPNDHAKRFPEDLFTNLLQTRNTFFDFSRLKNELNVLVKLKQFSGKSPAELMFFLKYTDIKEAMPELYRLCSLVLTLPSTCANPDPTFSVLERMRRHAAAVHTDRLTNRSLLAVESVLLGRLRNKAGFYEDVTNAFTRQGEKYEFTYIKQPVNSDEFACKSYF